MNGAPAGMAAGESLVEGVHRGLLRDVNGEVVLFNDSGMRTVGLVTASAVVDDGTVGRHVTADGVDVAGFRFYLFEGGLKLFYPPDLDLLLIRDRKPPR